MRFVDTLIERNAAWSALIRNAIRTPDGTVLESHHRHDFVSHVDSITGQFYFTDGGLDYVRRSTQEDLVDLNLYADSPHDVQRDVVKWGTYGKEGNSPLTYITVAQMETGHIRLVLEECNPRAVIKACMEAELMYRKGSV